MSTLSVALATVCALPLRVAFPPAYREVADLIKLKDASSSDKHWSRDEIADEVKKAVLEVIPVGPEKVTEDARFVKDLGMG